MFDWLRYFSDRFKPLDERSFKSFMYFCSNSSDGELRELALEYVDLPELFITMYPNFTYQQVYDMKWKEVKKRYYKILNELSQQSELVRQMEKLTPMNISQNHPIQRYQNYLIKEDYR